MNRTLTVALVALLAAACTKEKHCLDKVAQPITLPFNGDMSSVKLIPGPADPTGAGYADCLAALFKKSAISNPSKFDPGHEAVQNAHHENDSLVFSQTPFTTFSLFKLEDKPAYRSYYLYLALAPVGPASANRSGGDHYTILFTVQPSGELINSMLAGADGIQYIRNPVMKSPSIFTVEESTGKEGDEGPSYAAEFRVDDHGIFNVVKSEVDSMVTARNDSLSQTAAGAAVDESLLSVTGNDSIAGIRLQLFSIDPSIQEQYLKAHYFFGKKHFIAIGRTEPSTFSIFFMSIGDAPGTLKVNRIHFRPPAGDSLQGCEFRKFTITRKDNTYELTTIVSEKWAGSDGTPESRERSLVVSYDGNIIATR